MEIASEPLLRDLILLIVVETAESLLEELYVRTTLAPRAAKSRAMPSPIPREAPVMMAVLPDKVRGIDGDGVAIVRMKSWYVFVQGYNRRGVYIASLVALFNCDFEGFQEQNQLYYIWVLERR